MRRFRVPRRSALSERSLRELYQRVRILLTKTSGANLNDVLGKAQSAMASFFTKLGKPQFEYKEFSPDDPLDPDRFEQVTDQIKIDVQVGYEEVGALREMSICSHNYGQVRLSELKRRAEEVSGLVEDLQLLSDQTEGEVLVFSDRFKDSSKLDPSFRTEHAPCDVLTGQSSLTLNRIATLSVPADSITVTVQPLSPTGLGRTPTVDNTNRFYEGHFYSYLGQAEPEGGVFHIEESIDPASLTDTTQAAFEVPPIEKDKNGKWTKRTIQAFQKFVVPGGLQAQFLERLQSGFYAELNKNQLSKLLTNFSTRLHRLDHRRLKNYLYLRAHPNEGVLPSSDIPIGPENLTPIDMGGSAEELQAQRKKMLDGDPASYWQCEYAVKTNVLQDYVNNQPLLEEENIASLPSETREHLSGSLGRRKVSVEDLQTLAKSKEVDTQDFEVELLLTLDQAQTLNWITLNPMNFDSSAWLEVTDVSTSPDMESGFVPVESFLDHSSPNILTDEANDEVGVGTASLTLAPNRYSFRGTGIWPFSARQVKMVRFRIKQKTPVPSPYERIAIETNRSLTTVWNRK